MSVSFRLIETMRWDGEIALLDRHMSRLSGSAAFFGISLDPSAVLAVLEAAVEPHREDAEPARVRLTVDGLGQPTVSLDPLKPLPQPPRRVALSESRIDSDDVFRRHKTSRRDLYDREYVEALAMGLFEIVYLNELDRLAEGSRTNIFVESRGDLLTPPVAAGALPGVFRSVILATDPRARETILEAQDLRTADRLFVCNAVIGLVEVELIDSVDQSPNHRL